MSKKQGVKKGSAQAATFAQRKQDEKTMWTVKVIAYMQQEVLDTVALVLADGFGFGEDRQRDSVTCSTRNTPKSKSWKKRTRRTTNTP